MNFKKCKVEGLFVHFHLYVALKRLKIDLSRRGALTIDESQTCLWQLTRVGRVESDFKALMRG